MKLEQLFTAKELVLIDSGEYRPGRAVLDAKLALWAEIEREACAKVCDAIAQKMDDEGEGPTGNIGWVIDCAYAIRARGQA